ncbi:MAG: hypothetical protein ACETVZ_06335 [Phycisphaerae bacterium]
MAEENASKKHKIFRMVMEDTYMVKSLLDDKLWKRNEPELSSRPLPQLP